MTSNDRHVSHGKLVLSADQHVSRGKLVLTVDQIKQLANWVGHEPESEVSITKMVGDQGEGLYAFNVDHPDEGAIYLDGRQEQTPRIFSPEELFGRKIPNTTPELAQVAAKILHDYQATGCMGQVGRHATVTEVRSAVLTSPLGLFFLPWDSGMSPSQEEREEQRLIVANEGRQKEIRALFLDMEAARRGDHEEAAESARRDYIARSIAL